MALRVISQADDTEPMNALVSCGGWDTYVERIFAIRDAKLNEMRACDGGARFFELKGFLDGLELAIAYPLRVLNHKISD